jgi:UDP-perosamine 4-acetyltransferase
MIAGDKGTKEKVVLIGNGGHAKVVIDILEEMNIYEIIGVTTDRKDSDRFCGYPILGNDEVLLNLINNGVTHAAMGIGGFKDNNLRRKVYAKVKAYGFKFVSPIHPSAMISKSALIGEGTVIFRGVAINNDVRIGDNAFIATGSTIDHETIIEDHVLISAGVTIGAYTTIQEGALCALGAKIISGIKVGKNALIAAGAVVVNDIDDNAKVFGIPAKEKIREK